MESGFILIDKPPEWTSHDVVAYLRGVTKNKKIGHAGTLDPFATGLLIVGIGRSATKHLDAFHEFEKTYEAEIILGATSDTQDKDGKITEQNVDKEPTNEEVAQTLHQFIGEQEQTPPMYSAKKVKGKKLYELARKGQEIEREPNLINIHEIKLISYNFPTLKIEVTVSTGTYIRTLAVDIGTTLKTGAYCKELKRTSIGPYNLENLHELKSLTAKDIHSLLFFPEKLNTIDKN